MTAQHETLFAFSRWIWPLVARHVLEATAFAGAVALAAVALRRANAATRYAAWLLAVLKFALPVSVLAAMGSRAANLFPHTVAKAAWMPDLSTFVRLPSAAPLKLAAAGHNEFFCVLSVLWLAGAAACLTGWMRRILPPRLSRTRPANGTERHALARAAERLGCRTGIDLMIAGPDAAPGTWGVLRPRIMLPDGISGHLEAGELEATLMHEVAHVVRRDNLVAHITRVICSVFWFYPLVWWLERRIHFECERACDEMVVGRGAPSEQYVLAILKTCSFCVAGTATGFSGAAGSNLKKRMEQIMSHAVPARYSRACRALLGVAAAALVATPFAAGFLAAQSLTLRPGVEFVGAKVVPGPGKTSGHTQLLAALTGIMNPVVVESEVVPTDSSQKWLSEVAAYLITPEERAAFLALKSDAEREHFIEQFWKRRDPTPGTPENEFKEEHYRRIAWANENLRRAGIPGWKTDRGRLYIIMGPPDEREEHPGSYEIWTYNNVDDSTDKLLVTFNIR